MDIKTDRQQLKKDSFYDSIDRRLRDYSLVIANNDGGLLMQMLKISQIALQEIKNTDYHYKIFGDGYWGYGVNFIDDGITEHSNQDIRVIKKIPELNKHIKYNVFSLVVFKITYTEFTYSIFSFDLCSGKKLKHVNKVLKLKTLDNVSVIQQDAYSYIKLHFVDGTFFTFQTDFGYRIWDYTPDYKSVLDLVIAENKKVSEKQQQAIEEKLNVLVDKINGLADGQQIIYDDLLEAIETKGLPSDKSLPTKIKEMITDYLTKKGLEVILADTLKEVDKLF
jgi:hypothetical protein